jgi:hypothetical protein
MMRAGGVPEQTPISPGWFFLPAAAFLLMNEAQTLSAFLSGNPEVAKFQSFSEVFLGFIHAVNWYSHNSME